MQEAKGFWGRRTVMEGEIASLALLARNDMRRREQGGYTVSLSRSAAEHPQRSGVEKSPFFDEGDPSPPLPLHCGQGRVCGSHRPGVLQDDTNNETGFRSISF